ncbi:MAG: YafY family transcriptional regulator [Candidatus Dormibacteraeota bacterium]|nr:YafY family transcriptional regulator [Candidatus Dormibacteraeota bacterium]MBO0760943.1 YafY family transcriptional regulator [Candidatus Dormibacteraeota bacterium]
MATEVPARLLRLLSLLQSRREWSGAELAGRLDVTGRTVRRDVDRLRALGYPVEGTTGTAGGYRLASGRDLPPLLLDDSEAVAIAVGLRTAAGGSVAGAGEASVRALAKLEQILPGRLRQRIATLADATVSVTRPAGAAADPDTLGIVAAACRDHEVLAFQYRRRDGSSLRRRVEPFSLVTVTGLWYLVGFDVDRGDWRTFRLDRVEGPVPTRRRFQPRPLPAEDAAGYLRQALQSATYRHMVTAVVRAPADHVRARLPWALPGRVTPVDERACRVRLGSDSLDRLTQDLVAIGAHLTVEDASSEVLEHLSLVGERLARAAGHAQARPDRPPTRGRTARASRLTGIRSSQP